MVDLGHVSRVLRSGRSTVYMVNPRTVFTPEQRSPLNTIHPEQRSPLNTVRGEQDSPTPEPYSPTPEHGSPITKDQLKKNRKDTSRSSGTPSPSREKDSDHLEATRATWTAYATAWRARYGTDPIRGAKENALVKRLVDSVGQAEAPQLIAFYLTLSGYYASRSHPLDLLIKDVNGIRAQWMSGASTPRTSAPTNKPDWLLGAV